MNDTMIDQSVLAEDIAAKVPYEFRDYFLVKPLDPIKVTKTFTKPNPEASKKTDEDGIEVTDYSDVITETQEVNSDFRKGIVIKLPTSFTSDPNVADQIKVGDVVLFYDMAGKWFDLLKDSRLIRYYDIVALEK